MAKILSLFDGMACGYIAMQNSGVEIDRYVAYEIDKYAIKAATHNFPKIEEKGDVFKADFSEYEGFDYLIGGSPCTYWSIAQTKNRETVASGMGWELFMQYVRALREAKPKYFIYENNKSMSKQIRASINKAFGFEAVMINSDLVSAQNRKRLYWVGKRNADGTYSKVDVQQPDDKGILLRDILDTDADPFGDTTDGKAFCLTSRYYKGFGNNPEKCLDKHRDSMVAEPVNTTAEGKSRTIKAQYCKNSIANFCGYDSTYGATGVAEPCCMRYERTDEAKKCRKAYEAHEITHGYHELSELHPRMDGKTNTLSTVLKDNPVREPVYECPKDCDIVVTDNSIRCMRHDAKHSTVQGTHVNFVNGKSQTLSPSHVTKALCFATPCEWDENGNPTKAVSCADGKIYTVYKAEGGQITIKDKQYPIKLVDGYYIIRKLTVRECMRLQTVPEWYDFSVVSPTQAYKMLGNGWTCDVISCIINATKEVV